MRLKLYNMNRDFAAPADESKPIFLPFGSWPYDDRVSQSFDREHAGRIAAELAAAVAKGEPGIPVYQGHPDVPALAAKYPDKAALGWIRRIDPADGGVLLAVEWDRFPGRGFAWFSPYWFGEPAGRDPDGRTRVVVDHIASVGLVNNPNISEFRLPNEADPNTNNDKKENTMNREELVKTLGLAPDATDDQVRAALADLLKAAEKTAAAEQKAAEAEKAGDAATQDRDAAKKEAEAAKAEGEDTKEELENCRRELANAKAALANEKAALERLKALKTQSVAKGLPNERTGAGVSERMALVNENILKGMSFDRAWCAAKKQNPELFKD